MPLSELEARSTDEAEPNAELDALFRDLVAEMKSLAPLDHLGLALVDAAAGTVSTRLSDGTALDEPLADALGEWAWRDQEPRWSRATTTAACCRASRGGGSGCARSWRCR